MSNIPNTPVIQNLIINFIGLDQFTSLMPIFKLINEANGNIIKSRISKFESHMTGFILIDGHWDTITRIEDSIKNLSSSLDQELNLKVIMQRTVSKEQDGSPDQNNCEITREFIPYKISINNIDEPGLLEKITEFFELQEVTIIDLTSNSYTSEFGSAQVQIDIKIKIPSDIHIPSLKEQFDVLCYNENLDARLIPYSVS